MNLTSTFGDSYSLTFHPEKIEVRAYLKGSIAGGTNTEKISEIKGDQLAKFLDHLSASSVEEVEKALLGYDKDQIDDFLRSLSKYEKITYIWSETDWSDEK